jgi:hypothetical protein
MRVPYRVISLAAKVDIQGTNCQVTKALDNLHCLFSLGKYLKGTWMNLVSIQDFQVLYKGHTDIKLDYMDLYGGYRNKSE